MKSPLFYLESRESMPCSASACAAKAEKQGKSPAWCTSRLCLRQRWHQAVTHGVMGPSSASTTASSSVRGPATSALA